MWKGTRMQIRTIIPPRCRKNHLRLFPPPIFGPYFTSRSNKHTLLNPIFRYGCWHGAIKMLFPPLFSVANYDLRFSFSIVFFLRGFRIIKKRGWGANAISGWFFISPTSTLRFNPTSFDTQVNTSKNSWQSLVAVSRGVNIPYVWRELSSLEEEHQQNYWQIFLQ